MPKDQNGKNPMGDHRAEDFNVPLGAKNLPDFSVDGVPIEWSL
jgi:hypothetical protein